MNRYISGMKEIQAGDELKKQMIHHVQQQSARKRKTLSIKKTATLSAAACIIVFLVVLGAPLLQHENKKTAFGGFVITAYAADGTSIEMKPETQLPLGKYSPLMSSVPGFPIRIVAEEADIIAITVTEGNLLLWSPSDSKVIQKGRSMKTTSGTIVYWSPLEEGEEHSLSQSATVSVTALAGNKELGRHVIEINTDDRLNYSGVVKTP